MHVVLARAAAVAAIVLVVLAGPLHAQQETPPLEGRELVVHALSRLTFGPTEALVDEVEKKGLEAWFDEQVADPRPDRATIDRLAAFPTLWLDARTLGTEWYDVTGVADAEYRRDRARRDLTESIALRAVISKHQVAEVMADFWRNHFSIDRGKDGCDMIATEWDRVVIRDHVFGRFADMLSASAHHPAMLIYLDNHVSRRAPDATELKAVARVVRQRTGSRERGEEAARIAEQRGLNENYARELLELHTFGVDRDYTQKDVIAVAEALTGWTVDRSEGRFAFRFDENMHQDGEKYLLGRTIPRQKRRDFQREGEMVLERLASHRNTALFLAEKMCRYLVADVPPPELVESTAGVLRDTDLDLRAALRHVVFSEAFRDRRHHRAKFKTPMEFVLSAVRASGAEVEDPRVLVQVIAGLGQPIYGCEDPTGWSDAAEAWRDPGVMAGRWSFALALALGRLPGLAIPDHVLADLADRNDHVVIAALGRRVLPGGMRSDTVGFCLRALDRRRSTIASIEMLPQAARQKRLAELPSRERYVLALLLGSPEFQEQ